MAAENVQLLLTSLVTFQDDGGGAGAKTTILVEERDTTWLEANTAEGGLEAIFLEVTTIVAQLADTNEGAGLDTMSFAHMPGTLVTQPLICPIPWAVDSFLDPSDLMRIERQGSGSEGMRDVVTETSVGVCPCEATSGLGEGEPLVCKLTSTMSDLSVHSSVADYFSMEHIIVFLLHSPVNTFQMSLMVGEEELLPSIEGRTRDVVRTGMKGTGIDGARSAQGS